MTSLRPALDKFVMWWSRIFRRREVPNVTIIRTRPVESHRITPPQKKSGAVLQRQRDQIVVEPQLLSVPSKSLQRIVVEPTMRTDTVPVMRQPASYWEDKGWTKNRQTYTGYFGSNGYRCPGRIQWGQRGLRNCYIYSPPQELWRHPHHRCFCYLGDGKYGVHFQRTPLTVDAAIMTVEQVLNEAVGRRG